MPSLGDVTRFFRCQAFGKTTLPAMDLSGKTYVITGSNTGLGLDASKHLVRMGASKIILGVRNAEKGEAARSKIVAETSCQGKTDIEVWLVDLENFDSITVFAKRVRSELERIDGFVANAGIELTKFDMSEGLERTLTINVVATYFLVLSIWPALEQTSRQFSVDTRLTIVGSLIHYFGAHSQLKGDRPLQTLSDAKSADMGERYPLSKLLVHLLFREFVNRLPELKSQHQPIVNLVNPGWCGTELGRNKNDPAFERVMFSMIGRTCEEGSRTLVHGVTAPRDTHGEYLSECEIKPQSSYVQSEQGRKDGAVLWSDTWARLEKIDKTLLPALK